MKISSIRNISFKSNHRALYKKRDGSVYSKPATLPAPDTLVYKNYTCFFREDLNNNNSDTWDNFIKTIDENFRDAKRVNVYNFACSDGTETYSLIAGLKHVLGEVEAQKYFPIKASDIDEFMIKQAKSGQIKAQDNDIYSIERNVGSSIDDYFRIRGEVDSSNASAYSFTIRPKESLRNCANFEVSEFISQIDKIEPTNNLVLCRNLWPYLSEVDTRKAVEKFARKLDSTSLLVIGDFDREWGFTDEVLERYGFEQVSKNVFQKKKL